MTGISKYQISNLYPSQHLDEGIQSYIDSINNVTPKSKFDSILRSWEHLLRYTAYSFKDYRHNPSISEVRKYLAKKNAFNSAFEGTLKKIVSFRNKLTHEGPINEDSFKEAISFNEDFLNWFFAFHKIENWRELLYEKNDDYKVSLGTKDFYYVTKDFWDRNKLTDNQQLNYLLKYYLKLFSTSDYLKRIVASEKAVESSSKFRVEINDEPQNLTLEEIMSLAQKNSSCLMKILGEGGIGKSTFLWQIAHKYYDSTKIFFIEKIKLESLKGIEFLVKKLHSQNKNVLLLIDNVATEENAKISEFIELLLKSLEGYKVTVILAERTFRYYKKLNEDDFRFSFETEINIYYANKEAKNLIFAQIFQLLLNITQDTAFLETQKQHLQNLFLDESLESISESTIRIIRFLKKSGSSHLGFKYSYDWDDWKNFIEKNSNYKSLNNLYLIVALFYRFDIRLPINFCFPKFLDTNPIEINNAIGLFKDNNCPILIEKTEKGDFLRLRHEELSKWFFEDEQIQRNNAQYFFNKFIEEIKDRESSYLFRNILESYDDNGIEDSPVNLNVLTPETRLKLFINYLKRFESTTDSFSQEEFKVMMEIAKIYFSHIKDFAEAKNYLTRVINLETKDNPAIHARTKLAQIFYAERDYEECEKLYKEVERFDKEGTHALFGLSKLYYAWSFKDNSKAKLFELTQTKISDSAQINPSFASFYYDFIKNKPDSLQDVDFLKRTFKNNVKILMSIAQRQLNLRFFNPAENLLLFAIDEYPNDLYIRNLIGKFYIDKSEKFEHYESELLLEAVKYLEQSIYIEKNNPHTYTLLGKALTKLEKFKEAEEVLLTGCILFPDNLPPRNELGRLYRTWAYRDYYKDYHMRESLLKKSLKEFQKCQQIDPTHLHSKSELSITLDNLSKFYFSKGLSLKRKDKIKQAERFFQESTKLSLSAITILSETVKFSEKFIGKYQINDYKSVYTILGKIYNRLDKKDEAYEILTKTNRLFPYNFESNIELLDLLAKLSKNKNEAKADELKAHFYKLIASKISLVQRLDICETLSKYGYKELILPFLEKIELSRLTLPINYTQILNCYVSLKEYQQGFLVLKYFKKPDLFAKTLAKKIKNFYTNSKDSISFSEEINFLDTFLN